MFEFRCGSFWNRLVRFYDRSGWFQFFLLGHSLELGKIVSQFATRVFILLDATNCISYLTGFYSIVPNWNLAITIFFELQCQMKTVVFWDDNSFFIFLRTFIRTSPKETILDESILSFSFQKKNFVDLNWKLMANFCWLGLAFSVISIVVEKPVTRHFPIAVERHPPNELLPN